MVKLDTELETLQNFFKTAWQALKKLSIGKQSAEKLPWYLVIGPSDAGKSSLLHHSGLNFFSAQHLIDPADEGEYYKRCNWWYSTQATLLDIPGWYLTTLENSTEAPLNWQQLLTVLRKYTKRKALAGVILTLDLSSWGLLNKNAQHAVAQNLRQAIYLLSKQIKTPCPFYLLLNKVDRIIGFREFFADLNPAERQQSWGMDFSTEKTADITLQNLPHLFKTRFDDLLKNLYERVIYRLHQERNVRKRALIQGFPLQLETFKAGLTNLVYQLADVLNLDSSLRLKGIYLASNLQHDLPIDFLPNISNQNQFLSSAHATSTATPARSLARTHFTQQLFQKIVGTNANSIATGLFLFRHFNRRLAIYSAIALLAISSTALMAHRLTTQLATIDSAQQALAEYNLLVEQLTPESSHDLMQILPALNALQRATFAIENTPNSWLISQGLHQSNLSLLAAKTYHQALVSYFLPNLSVLLEQPLTNKNDPTLLYGALKTYLMLGDPSHFNPTFINAWLTAYWQQTLANNPGLRKQLEIHLSALLSAPITPIELNPQFIATARNILNTTPLPTLSYAILKNHADDTMVNLFANNPEQANLFNKVFVLDSNSLQIASFYTAKEFQNIYFDKVKNACTAAFSGDWVLGEHPSANHPFSEQSLLKAVQARYLQDYSNHWTALLANLQITPWQSWQQAQSSLNTLTSNQSPLIFLLQTVNANTAPTQLAPDLANLPLDDIENIKSNLTDKFQSINGLAALGLNKQPSKTLNQVFVQLNSLRDYLNHIGNANDSDKAAFTASKNRFADTNNQLDAISTLHALANTAPGFLQSWLNTYANNAWQLILNRTDVYLNQHWQTDVMPFYNLRINNRYPLLKDATQDITLADFSHFFSPDGIFTSYFNNYLAPFIDTSQTQWQWRKFEDQSLNLNPQLLIQLERANIIRSMFFAKNQPLAVQLSLQLIELEPGLRSITFAQNEQTFSDHPGTKTRHNLSWPDPTETIALTFTTEGDQQTTTTETGPWALFKLFDKANLQSTDNPQHFLLTFDLNGNAAQYQLFATQLINPFIPKIVDQFRCPQQLTEKTL